MITVTDIHAVDGRVLRMYDTGPVDGGLTVVWHHGSPQTGEPLEPIVTAAARRGIRVLSYARPSYGGSTALPGRNVASAAGDVATVADAAGVDRFAVMGASGGGPHALACAAVLPDRVVAVMEFATLAPFGAPGLDWYAGMAGDGPSLKAAEQGRAARELFEETAEFDADSFVQADYDALDGPWASLGRDVGESEQWGSDGLVSDDLAFVSPWGFDVIGVAAPTLLVHGTLDRVVPWSHSDWLAAHLPDSELWIRDGDGHVSVLNGIPDALDWFAARP